MMFMQMANALAGINRRPERDAILYRDDMSKTERMRVALMDGPKTSRELAAAGGLTSTALVGALLKVDLRRGRVQLRDGVYSLDPAFDAGLQAELAEAAAMLRRAGYTVTPPPPKGPLCNPSRN